MRTLSVFNQVSLDGYICDERGDMSWAHRQDPEWGRFVSRNAGGGGALVFGRVTYELMVRYWPTAAARAANPVVADRMTAMPKVVFSRTLRHASWENTTVIRTDPAAAIRRLKRTKGPDLVILGSGHIVSQLTTARLIDAYTTVVVPVVLGRGRTMFEGVKRTELVLTGCRRFANGNVVLRHERLAR